MQSCMFYCLFALSVGAVSAARITFDEYNMPIKVVDTSLGQNDHARVTYLKAEIYQRHLTTGDRINFPKSGYLNDYFNEGKAKGDERGHLVASQFSGPAEWYNLSPQNPRVNRNLGYQSLTISWFDAECKVRQFLQQGGGRHVDWVVEMTYVGKSNRPRQYHLQVEFQENGRVVDAIDTMVANPLLEEDSTFWICRDCRSNRHGNDGCSRG